jgi:acyl-CoA reductase-like NAD-dependent aldehyde dehydrogenase
MQQVAQAMRTEYLEGVRLAQRAWVQTPLHHRVRIIRKLRRLIASDAPGLAGIVPIHLPGAFHRTVADTMVAEVLPLLEACRFLEREAETILRSRQLGSYGRPMWLAGIEGEVERAPWGVVLILGASNYPLLLAGVQALQALVAGNAVLWKPAPGTAAVAFALRALLLEAGLVPELLTLLDPATESATEAIVSGVDHVVLTGSAETGKAVMHQLAETLTPSTMELSGCDAVFVLPGADLDHAVDALAFGLRFNGSFTCMAPRRVFLIGHTDTKAIDFEMRLATAVSNYPPVTLSEKAFATLHELIHDARAQGGEILLDGVIGNLDTQVSATLIAQATPALLSMQTEIFAPVVSVMRVANADEALAANAACPYALTASIFSTERDARAFMRSAGNRLRAGNVLINDVIIPTADPRIPFGGRGRSGFGVTRGAEGLLAMTTPRTIQMQRGKSRRAYDETSPAHTEFFTALIRMLHGGSFAVRWNGLKRLMPAARKLK